MLTKYQLLLLFVLKHPLYVYIPTSLPLFIISLVPQTLFEQVPTCAKHCTRPWGYRAQQGIASSPKSEDTAHCWPTLEVVSNPICSKGTDSQEETETLSGICHIASSC